MYVFQHDARGKAGAVAHAEGVLAGRPPGLASGKLDFVGAVFGFVVVGPIGFEAPAGPDDDIHLVEIVRYADVLVEGDGEFGREGAWAAIGRGEGEGEVNRVAGRGAVVLVDGEGGAFCCCAHGDGERSRSGFGRRAVVRDCNLDGDCPFISCLGSTAEGTGGIVEPEPGWERAIIAQSGGVGDSVSVRVGNDIELVAKPCASGGSLVRECRCGRRLVFGYGAGGIAHRRFAGGFGIGVGYRGAQLFVVVVGYRGVGSGSGAADVRPGNSTVGSGFPFPDVVGFTAVRIG